MSRQVVIASFLVGVLVATPVAAQRQRNPGGGGSAARGASGGRPVAGPQNGGGRPSAGRSYEQPRVNVAPPSAARQAAPSPSGAARYAVPRGQSHAGGSYAAPRYANRGYAGRPVDPGYGVRPGYGYGPGRARNPGYGYAAPRSYAVPRGYVSARPYGHRSYGYGYYGPPRYVAPGWRGPWGYAVVTPRFVYPAVISYGYWEPYYYRPSIGIGIYYGSGGLYPFGAIPSAYYNPSPSVAYGGLRITDAPRDAQVFADGNYVGIVDDFDGAFQHLNLEAGQPSDRDPRTGSHPDCLRRRDPRPARRSSCAPRSPDAVSHSPRRQETIRRERGMR